MPSNLLEWSPLPKQKKFIEIPHIVKEGLFGGAAGPGKTELLVLLPLLYQFYTFPGFKGIIFRRKFTQVQAELVVRADRFYKATGGKYNAQHHRWHWPEFDSYMDFGHMEYDKDVYNYDSAEYQYIAFDELTSFTEFQYTYMFTRNRSTIRGLPSIVRSATNPGNIGHNWVRRRFIEPYRVAEETIVEGGDILNVKLADSEKVTDEDGNVSFKEARILRCYIHATMDDNTHLMENSPEYAQGIMALTDESERRAKRYGDWWTFTGQVFENWRPSPFPGEPERACHIIEPFDIPLWWPRVLTLDWGFSAMLWAGWLAISPEKRVYLYREYHGTKLNLDVWATDIMNLSKDEHLDDFVMDWNCFESRGEDQTLAEQFMDLTGMNPRPADKGPGSRISGQKLLKEYFRWQARPVRERIVYNNDYAQWILSQRGLDAYKDYLDMCNIDNIEEDVTNLPRFQSFNTCPILNETIPLCIYDEDNPEDVAEFEGDDPYDGLRYGIRAVKALLDKASTEADRIMRRARLAQLAETDQTAFQHLPKDVFDITPEPIKLSRLGRRRGPKNRQMRNVLRLG